MVFDEVNLKSFVRTPVYELFDLIIYMYFDDFRKEIENDDCVICLDVKPTIYFPSCGHTCICNDCKNMLEEQGIKCPLCRKINRIIINKNV